MGTMRNGMLSIGVDVGATKIHCGVVDAHGNLMGERIMRSWANPDRDANIEQMLCLIKELLHAHGRERIGALGMGFPGSVDDEKGLVVYTPNLRWNELPIAELVRKATGLRPQLIQDTGAAVWGEYLYGAGKGLQHVACATIGSGIAVGIVANGRLYGGAAHTAGEIGHMHVEDDGLLCGCGKRGCLEAYASGLGLVKIYHSGIVKTPPWLLADISVEKIDSRAIFGAAKQGDRRCLDCIDYMARMLARGLNATAAVLAPEVLILSGGLSAEHELLFEPTRRYFEQYAYRSVRKHVRLALAQLGENAPLIGAAALHLAPSY